MHLLFLACAAPPEVLAETCEPEPDPPPPAVDGRELFLRSWTPGDLRAKGGDGLGPVYNDVSCVACHAQGGPGGSGGRDHDVFLEQEGGVTQVVHRVSGGPRSGVESLLLALGATPATPEGVRALSRNTPALFGAGLVDAVPDDVLLDEAAVSDPDFPEVTGRVARDPDGRVARFGWKGQVADLPGFVAKACANELGLDVPTEAQPGRVDPLGNDLDDADVAALAAYVAGLPAPDRVADGGRGEALFRATGCETCHREQVGALVGAFSDLLLHDMGPDLADDASGYGVRTVRRLVATEDGPARAGEWRTPPLWGVRDSAPYLHDGRAATLDAAIRLHDGEAAPAAARYRRLSDDDRWALQAFLRTLVAPGAA